ncbi:INO80 complex subunit B-like isoform X1 [Acipenser ruthenus]|uniref:INO80 complex subunit B-like isoform X1 n=1 Tax=Acipenser ruthenus TaxID=7906 RepID=UPI00145B85D6|nr:INO80 complex subunit B-like isoform X1 [Acipenser ruthenus]
MGKRKEMVHEKFLSGDGDESVGHSLHKKKHKKHKKHKKKHQEEVGPSFSSEALESDSGVLKPQLKLKIKLGGQTLGTKSVPTFTVVPELNRSPSPLMILDDEDEQTEGVPIEQYRAWLDEDSNLDPSPLAELESGSLLVCPEDEEEKWLDALEKGELDDNGELKKNIDESLLTARQKALLHKQQSQPLLELPMGYKEKEMTEEMMQKREEKARKRRLQAAKKAEENKNQTIERLTKTNKAKIKTMRERKYKQSQCPMVRYNDSFKGTTISYPHGVATPSVGTLCPLPTAVHCGVSGCLNMKKYSCSKTGIPLCSLGCYKKNRLIQGLA